MPSATGSRFKRILAGSIQDFLLPATVWNTDSGVLQEWPWKIRRTAFQCRVWAGDASRPAP
jgi:hypothetical protein